jgi:hypothetical protein
MARKMSKWQKASADITRLKWEIETALTADFTEKDKESEKYTQLLETLDILMNHCIGKYREEQEEKKKEYIKNLEKKSSIWGLRSLLIAIISAVVSSGALQLLKLLYGIAKVWWGAS